MPSAAVRSSLPFSKARRVNSPAPPAAARHRRQAVDDSGQDGAAAMEMQLGHVLAGEAGRPGKPERPGRDRARLAYLRMRDCASSASRGAGNSPPESRSMAAIAFRSREPMTAIAGSAGRRWQREDRVHVRSGWLARFRSPGQAAHVSRRAIFRLSASGAAPARRACTWLSRISSMSDVESVAVPDAFGIDHHGRPELAAVEATGRR